MNYRFALRLLIVSGLVLCHACSSGQETDMNDPMGMEPFTLVETGGQVIVPPAGVHPFYKKYINAAGILIVSSDLVPDAALVTARETVTFLLSIRPDMHQAMLKSNPRIAILAVSETASDLPEFGAESDGQWGLGQMPGDPTSLVSEKGICYAENTAYRANFLMHEFVHMLHNLAMPDVEPDMVDDIYSAYVAAVEEGRFPAPIDEPLKGITPFDAYGDDEYFTHAVNAWYDLDETLPGPWMDVKIGEEGLRSGTKAELLKQDPAVCAIIERLFPADSQQFFQNCHMR